MVKAAAPRRQFRAKAQKLWDEITGTYRLRPDELRILEEACREIELVDRLEAALAGAELTVHGSQGQPVANPLVAEVRQHRQVVKALLGSLKLPDEDDARMPGDASVAGRALAANRWRHGA